MLVILIEAISQDEKKKINQIFVRLNKKMYSIAFQRLGNSFDVEEALSETFLKIMKNIDKISSLEESKIDAYCITILKNETINIIRKREKIIYANDLDIFLDIENLKEKPVEDKYLEVFEIDSLKRSVDRLTCEEKMFIELRFINEMKIKDISRLFDISEEAGKKRSQRIIKKLKLYYREECKYDY